MISEEEYEAAIASKQAADKVIQEYGRQRLDQFKERWARFEAGGSPFTDEDLIYAAFARCKCGAGLAYPKTCSPFHKWDCAAILKGTADAAIEHQYSLPFAFYDVKSEGQASANGATTRPNATERLKELGANPDGLSEEQARKLLDS